MEYSFNYSFDTTNMSETNMVVVWIVFLVLYIFFSYCLSRLFRKAGGVTPWYAWVPILNVVKVLNLGGFSGWWILINFVPFLGPLILLIISIIAAHNINLKLGKGIGSTVLAILLEPIWLVIIAFDQSVWNESLGKPRKS